MLIMFQVFLSFNAYDEKISNFTLVTELKQITLCVLSNTENFISYSMDL